MFVREECLNEFQFSADAGEVERTAATHVLRIDVGLVMENKVNHVMRVVAVLAHPKKHIVNFEHVLADDILDRF
jgi:hypothetical protein